MTDDMKLIIEDMVAMGMDPNRIDLQEVRQFMGLAPDDFQNEDATIDYRNGGDIGVTLIYKPRSEDLYHAIYSLVKQTWNETYLPNWALANLNIINWVVENPVLLGMTQPMALELPTFVFAVRNAPRSTMDQIFRTRIGAAFSARGERDNDCRRESLVVPERFRIEGNGWTEASIDENHRHTMELYSKLIDDGSSWQEARFVLPMGLVSSFLTVYNWQSLRNMLGSRMALCEQPETVEVAWQMASEIGRQFSWEWSRHLLPRCVHACRCLYADGGVKSLFSNLHDHHNCPIFRLLHPDEKLRMRGEPYFYGARNLAVQTWENYPKIRHWIDRYIRNTKAGLSPFQIYREARL
jgi:hypothetical protein